MHGVRSADVNCMTDSSGKVTSNLAVCQAFNGTYTPEQTFAILRDATSLEAFTGLRAEFWTVGSKSKSPLNLYVKSQAGFLTVAGTGKLIPNHETIALGAIATSGRFYDSFLDFGYGRTKLFGTSSNNRWKMNGYLTWDGPGLRVGGVSLGKLFRPFVEMTVDTDLGPGSDSVQSYYGINFDVDCVFHPANCSSDGGKSNANSNDTSTGGSSKPAGKQP